MEPASLNAGPGRADNDGASRSTPRGAKRARVSRNVRSRLLLVAVVALALAIAGVRDFAGAPTAVHNAFGRGPTIALVHGLGSRPSHWLPTARLLARSFRVTLIDLPGHGVTGMPDPFSLEQAVTALDRALGDDSREPVVLVGHSLGGLVAASEAIEHPGRVRALVLVETALRPQVEPQDRAALLAELDAHYQALLRAAYLDFGRDSTQGEALYREVAALDSATIKRWIRLAWTADLSARAAGIEAPVLAVLAPRSWATGEPWPETARALGYGRIPDLHAARLAGCGHFVMLDRPAELADLIARFAARAGGEQVARR